MACIESALKGSFRKEMSSLKPNLHEEIWAVNVPQSVVVSVDDFSIDDLFDFSNMANNEDEFLTHGEEEEEENQTRHQVLNNNDNSSLKDDILSSELNLPEEELADLEWLSHFVEDSFTEYSLTHHAITKPVSRPEKKQGGLETGSVPNPCFISPVPVKTRSKRTRTGRGWSISSSTLTETSSSSTSSCTSSNSVDSLVNSVTRPYVAKKMKKRSSGVPGGSTQPPRRCSHCGVQKTPQWRAGPLGAKTLCNACGVRFKSGRLLPEYRPACSPTFSSELHSNSHRKVLEMRRKKEVELPESGLVSVGF